MESEVLSMIIQGDNREQEIKGLDEVELQHLGKQLLNYVTTYRKMIRITTPDVEHKLNILFDIGTKIVNQQYELLFNDPSVVIPNVKCIPLSSYQTQLGEQYNCFR